MESLRTSHGFESYLVESLLKPVPLHRYPNSFPNILVSFLESMDDLHIQLQIPTSVLLLLAVPIVAVE